MTVEEYEVSYDISVCPKAKMLQAKPNDSLREQVEAAVKYCPNHVISVVDITGE